VGKKGGGIVLEACAVPGNNWTRNKGKPAMIYFSSASIPQAERQGRRKKKEGEEGSVSAFSFYTRFYAWAMVWGRKGAGRGCPMHYIPGHDGSRKKLRKKKRGEKKRVEKGRVRLL